MFAWGGVLLGVGVGSVGARRIDAIALFWASAVTEAAHILGQRIRGDG
jgi:hypothetical protein